jgi:hypothetical protein
MAFHLISLFLALKPPTAARLSHGDDRCAEPRKGSGSRGLLKEKEKQMKLITRHELASKSILELRGLYRTVFNALVQSVPESAQRRNALASLENISREINQRYSEQWKLDAGL